MKDIAIKIVNIALVVVTVFLTLMSGVLLYYKTIGKDKVPSAITSTYATTVEDPQTGEQLPTIEANYYSNRNISITGNGSRTGRIVFSGESEPWGAGTQDRNLPGPTEKTQEERIQISAAW